MNGIIYVVFGKEYERFALECLSRSRENTKHPFHILTNLVPSPKWKKIKNVSFKYFDLKDNENRQVKTSAVYHSPFENSLLLDCDTIIQKEINFGILKDADVVLNEFLYWKKGVKILRIYKRAFDQFNVSLPVSIYNGAFVMFKNNGKVKEFFNSWHRYWKLFGRKREMPCLAATAYHTNAKVKKLNKGYFAVEVMDVNAIIQHNANGFCDKFKIKSLNKKNTMAVKGDFNWVDR